MKKLIKLIIKLFYKDNVCLFLGSTDILPPPLSNEEEIKYLFVDTADRFDNIPGFKADERGSGIASIFRSDSFLIKYEDGCFDMRSKRFQKTQGWASEVYVIPCCVLSKDEFSQGI